ncbi:MAG: polysaccharide biosynthesis/export family protein [Candidatus Acidiferrales bacterium]
MRTTIRNVSGAHRSAFILIAGLLLTFGGVARGQESGQASAPAAGAVPAAASPTVSDEYKIGPGDIISVVVVDTPELGGKFRISDTGSLQLPELSEPIHADGQSPQELAHTVRMALMDAKQARDPKVSIFVEQFHGRTVTILGAVMKPSVYALERRTTVLEALSMAGGLLPNAGNIITVIRGRASAESTNTPVGSVEILDMSKLTKGQDLAANVEIRNGDTVTVSSAAIVYVVGAVMKPGGYAMLDSSDGMSVVQAVALAQGFTSVAATHRGIIVRQSSSDIDRQEIPVDIAQLMTGKATDVPLAPNDIVFIPESGTKKTLKVMGDIAMAAVNGIAVYGVGYRVGQIN